MHAETARLAVTAAPTPADFAALFRLLDQETALHIGPCDVTPLAILLHGPDGAVTGGLWGRITYAWLVVEMLFVPPALRGTGTGTRLLAAAEREALARDCVGIQITRLDFQAPTFYEKSGFTVFGEQHDVPPGHRCLYLQKRLTLPVLSFGRA